MTALTLESLGLSKEQLQEMLLDRMVEQAMVGVSYDEDGNEYRQDSSFAGQLKKMIYAKITASIQELAEKHVLPNVGQYIENLTLQTTNQWGEKKGAPVTFIEYLVHRADAYMREEVDNSGKSKEEAGYHWSKCSTRVTFLINQHLHYSIHEACKQMLGTSQATVAKAIEEAVKVQLGNIVTQFNLSVKATEKR